MVDISWILTSPNVMHGGFDGASWFVEYVSIFICPHDYGEVLIPGIPLPLPRISKTRHRVKPLLTSRWRCWRDATSDHLWWGSLPCLDHFLRTILVLPSLRVWSSVEFQIVLISFAPSQPAGITRQLSVPSKFIPTSPHLHLLARGQSSHAYFHKRSVMICVPRIWPLHLPEDFLVLFCFPASKRGFRTYYVQYKCSHEVIWIGYYCLEKIRGSTWLGKLPGFFFWGHIQYLVETQYDSNKQRLEMALYSPPLLIVSHYLEAISGNQIHNCEFSALDML